MLSNEQKSFYNQKGFLIVRDVFSSQEVARLKSACQELESKASEKNEDYYEGSCFFNLFKECDPFDKNINQLKTIKGCLRRVTYPYLVSQDINDLRTQTKMIEAVSDLLGDDLVQIVNQVNFNPPQIGKGWGWHQDYRFRREGIDDLKENYVQCLIAIDPCSEKNGCLKIIPESDQLGGLALDRDVSTAEQFFDSSKAVSVELSPGDMVMFNPFMIHGSGQNQSESPRRVFINGFANGQKSRHGVKVYTNKTIIKIPQGFMEYEDKKELISPSKKRA